MRRGALLFAVLVSAAGCGDRTRTTDRKAQPSPPAKRPDVLLITIDTLRADHLGIYGYGRKTSPHIDALGREGVVFDQAYTYWPKTRGSMAVMLTGRTPSRNGYGQRSRASPRSTRRWPAC